MKQARFTATLRGWAPWAPMLFGVLAGCAAVSTGPYGTPVDSAGQQLKGNRTDAGLRISGAEDTWYSSANFGFIVLTFENDTDNWVRIEQVKLQFGGTAKDAIVTIPAGEQLRSWAEATLQLRAIRAGSPYFVEPRPIADSIIALWANPRASSAAGPVVPTTAEPGLAAGAPADATESFPREHLLHVPFEIPPHLFTRRWLVLQTPTRARTPCVDVMLVDYQPASAPRERVWVRLTGASSSAWQAQTCPNRNSASQGGL